MTPFALLARAAGAVLLAAGCASSSRAPADSAPRGAPATPAAGSAAAPGAGASLPTAAERADRWQILLNDGRYMYEVHLVRAAGDTLVVTSAADTAAVPLADIDELRLVQASSIGTTDGGRRTRGGLVGADDAVIKLARFEQAERRRIVADLMAERAGTAARP